MRFKKGSNVEVLSKMEVPSGSWRCAEIICGNGHNYTVRYAGTTNEEIAERVSRNAIRPCCPLLEVSESWVPGDVVEVFDNFSWKMATVSKALGKKHFLVRLLASSLEFKVGRADIRLRQSWQDEKWVVIGKGSGNCEDGKCHEIWTLKYNQHLGSQFPRTKMWMNSQANGDCFPVKKKTYFQESHTALSKNLKRGSPYDNNSRVEGYADAAQKVRVIEKGGRFHRAIAANSSNLPKQVNAVVLPRKMPDERYLHTPLNSGRTGLSGDPEKRKLTDGIRCLLAGNLELSDADSIACSVGSCSVTCNNSCKLPCTGPIEADGNFSDAESHCQWGYEEGNCLPPNKVELAAEIHRLELHAYRCTIEALHASGPLSWEQEALVTNLRLSLHISNDEHLMEIRNLISANNKIPIR